MVSGSLEGYQYFSGRHAHTIQSSSMFRTAHTTQAQDYKKFAPRFGSILPV